MTDTANTALATTEGAAPTEELDLFSAHATDETLELNGVSVKLEGMGNRDFLLARVNNENYNRLARKLYKQNQAVLRPTKGDKAGERLANAKALEIEIEILANTVLLGWEGSILFQGEKLTYSPKNAIRLLKIKAIRDIVVTRATEPDDFKVVKEEAEKN